jgi:hypothetical protein
MVAIIRCDRDEAERRDSGREIAARRGMDSTLNINRRRKIWNGGSHLTLLIDRLHGGDYVTSLGWTTKLRNSSADLDLVLEVSRVEEIPSPVQYSDVVDLVPRRFHDHLVHEGTMSEGTGKALVDALIQVRPNLREVIERIEGVARQYPIRDSLAGQAMAMQRDATRPSARSGWRECSVRCLPSGTARAGRSPVSRCRSPRRSAAATSRSGSTARSCTAAIP